MRAQHTVFDPIDNIIHHLSKDGVLHPAQVPSRAHEEEPRDAPFDPVRLAVPPVARPGWLRNARSLAKVIPVPCLQPQGRSVSEIVVM